MEQFDPPGYIASLIAAVNEGAKSAQLGALAFVAIGLFLLATTFSATDEDLLLDHAITISQLGGTQVPVVLAFGLAPAVFVAAHFYTLIRYDMLAGNVRQLMNELRSTVPEETDRERCRQLLANVEFVQALVTPKDSSAYSRLFYWTAFAMLAVFPVAVLLLVQIGSLRLQHVVVNGVYRACIVADLLLLMWFFWRQSSGEKRGFRRAALRRKAKLLWVPLLVMVAEAAWLTIPGPNDGVTVRSNIYTVPSNILEYRWPVFRGAKLPDWLMVVANIPRQPIDLLLCPLVGSGWGCRFLTVTNRVLVTKVWDEKTFVDLRGGADLDTKHAVAFEPVSLRGRVLRFANLERSELFGADLSGAQLQGADLQEAQLQGANLREARSQGAQLYGAQLQRADLSGAQLQGANLPIAQLQGAIMFEAQLQGANLFRAQLQSASLGRAQLQGAHLGRTQLQGADLRDAQLQGADLRDAQLQGADLRGTRLWNVHSDAKTEMSGADLRGVSFDPLGDSDLAQILAAVPELDRNYAKVALSARADAAALRPVSTTQFPILTDDPAPAGLSELGVNQRSTDERAHFEYLADKVAAMSPEAAGGIAIAAREDQNSTLACRLLANVAAGSVKLDSLQTNALKNTFLHCPAAPNHTAK